MKNTVNVGFALVYNDRGVISLQQDIRSLSGQWQQLNSQISTTIQKMPLVRRVTMANLASGAVLAGLRALKADLGQVVAGVEELPNVSQYATRGIAGLRSALTQLGEVRRSWLAEAAGTVVGNFLGASIEDFVALERSAKALEQRLQDAERARSERARRQAQEDREATQAAKELQAAQAALVAARQQHAEVGESVAARGIRLESAVMTATVNASIARREALAAESDAEHDLAMARAARFDRAAVEAQTQLERARLELSERRADLQRQINAAGVAQVSIEERLADLYRESAALVGREISLDLEEQTTAVLVERAQMAARLFEITRDMGRLEKQQADERAAAIRKEFDLRRATLRTQLDQLSAKQMELGAVPTGERILQANAIEIEKQKIWGQLLALQAEYRDRLEDADVGNAPAQWALQEQPSRSDRAEADWNLLQMRTDVTGLEGAWRGVVAAMMEYRTNLGTVEDQWATLSGSMISSLEGGIASSIEGLISRTMTWREALENIGSAILTSLIRAFAQMIAQWVASWIAGQIAMLVARRSMAAGEHALAVTQAGAAAGMWAPAAASASIATFGAAAAAGTASYLTALGTSTAAAVTMAAIAGGVTPRERGGPVRAGMPYIVGERRPELFIPETNGMILPRVPTGGAGQGASRQVNVAVFDRRTSLRRWMEGIQGDSILMDLASGREARFA
jgi:hypothetical protein